MAYTVKRKPERAAKERSSILEKVKIDSLPIPTGVVKEGAHEVSEKLRQDFSRWSRVRRVASLKPMVGCLACDATGRVACGACEGSGNQKLVWNDEVSQCATCAGSGTITCVECMGRGQVENVHRKKMIGVLIFGGLAWAYILFRLWGGDVLPEQRAKYISGGGGGGATGKSTAPEHVLGHAAPRGGGTGNGATNGAPSGHANPSGAPARSLGARQPGVGSGTGN